MYTTVVLQHLITELSPTQHVAVWQNPQQDGGGVRHKAYHSKKELGRVREKYKTQLKLTCRTAH